MNAAVACLGWWSPTAVSPACRGSSQLRARSPAAALRSAKLVFPYGLRYFSRTVSHYGTD